MAILRPAGPRAWGLAAAEPVASDAAALDPAIPSSAVRGRRHGGSLMPEPPIFPAVAAPLTSTPPPPTIQVTIGRVEVRAATSGEPARQQRQQPMVMSLDDYLRQCAGGG